MHSFSWNRPFFYYDRYRNTNKFFPAPLYFQYINICNLKLLSHAPTFMIYITISYLDLHLTSTNWWWLFKKCVQFKACSKCMLYIRYVEQLSGYQWFWLLWEAKYYTFQGCIHCLMTDLAKIIAFLERVEIEMHSWAMLIMVLIFDLIIGSLLYQI